MKWIRYAKKFGLVFIAISAALFLWTFWKFGFWKGLAINTANPLTPP